MSRTEPEQDLHSFEDIYRTHWSPMVRLAWLMTGDRQVAEDVVHDVFLRIEPRWREITDLQPYIRRSVINQVQGQHRRRLVERRHAPAPPDPTFNPEVEEVWRFVAELPVRQRHALVLRFYLDLPIQEVAELLGCPEGTAKSLIHRGVQHLRKRIDPDD